jgi:ATP-dependent Lhr-like helicase
VPGYDPVWLSQFFSSGEAVWVGESNAESTSDVVVLSRMRFFQRGTGSLWIGEEEGGETEEKLSEHARAVRAVIADEGASFTLDIEAITGFTPLAVKEALRELAALGLVTNDTVEAMREVIRWKPLDTQSGPDPTRWLPADYRPSSNRHVVQKRPNLRRIPKWRRPDRAGAVPSNWGGRWSLVYRLGTLGRSGAIEDRAAEMARYWLDRYGIVSREIWRRERPKISWRTIYHELKRMEFRGEVRRGYFVKGLAGAQFATSAAVEQLRAIAEESENGKPFIVMAASDPANIYTLPLDLADKDPLSRPRGTGGLIVTRAGRVALSVEGRGRRVVAAEWMEKADVSKAKEVLALHLRGEKNARYLMLPDIGGKE